MEGWESSLACEVQSKRRATNLLGYADVLMYPERLLLSAEVAGFHGPKPQGGLALDGRDVGQGLLHRGGFCGLLLLLLRFLQRSFVSISTFQHVKSR